MNQYIIRVLSSFAGWLIWTIWFVAIYFLSITLLPLTKNNPTWWLTIIFMIFAWTMLNNIVSNLFISFSNSQKYSRFRSSIWQTFTLNICLFLVSLPFYLESQNLQQIALIYIIISSIWSSIILEALACEWKYILSGIYWSIIWSFIISLLFVKIAPLLDDYTMMFFFIMPIINMILTICIIIAEYINQEISKTLKTNFLDINTNYWDN